MAKIYYTTISGLIVVIALIVGQWGEVMLVQIISPTFETLSLSVGTVGFLAVLFLGALAAFIRLAETDRPYMPPHG